MLSFSKLYYTLLVSAGEKRFSVTFLALKCYTTTLDFLDAALDGRLVWNETDLFILRLLYSLFVVHSLWIYTLFYT